MEEINQERATIRTHTNGIRAFVWPVLTVFVVVYWFTALIGEPVSSSGGLGYWVSSKSRVLFGEVAWLFPLAGLYWLVEHYIMPKKYRNPISWGTVITGFGMLIFTVSTLTYILLPKQSSGGFVGFWLSGWTLDSVGVMGSIFTCIVLILLSLSLMFSVSWRRVFIDTGMKTLRFIDKFKKTVDVEKSPQNFPSQEKPTKNFFIYKKDIKDDDRLTDSASLSDHADSIANSESVAWYKKLFFWLRKREKTLDDHDDSIHTLTKKLDLDSVKNIDFTDKENMDLREKLSLPTQSNQSDQSLNFDASPRISPESLDLDEEQEDNKKKTNPTEQTFNIRKAEQKTISILKTKRLPPLSLLNSETTECFSYTDEKLNQMGSLLEQNLKYFSIETTVKAIQPGPVVTLFEIAPAPGVKVGQIVQLSKDLARSLAVRSVRVVEVIPGKVHIGIEIPNSQREQVNFYQVLSSGKFQSQKKPLTIALGKDIGGEPVTIDLAKTPHLLVAGTTGSGKSVGINSMILSLLYKSLPDEVRMILIDPKMLELSVYENIPHLIMPVVTDMGGAATSLKWAVAEMERRYKLMSLLGVRNIIGYNEKIEQAEQSGSPLKDPMFKPQANYSFEQGEETPSLQKIPYIVIIIDEFADLIMMIGKPIEELIARLAQKARAAGIHLILATQRPSVNVITGLIKANIPTRLSFQVSTKIDSRTILDQSGAEQLLGLGDMLYLAPGSGAPLRVHGAFVSDAEVHKTVKWLINHHYPPSYVENVQEQTEQTNSALGLEQKTDDEDDLFSTAWEVVSRTRKTSISRIQRELRIGYNRAARLVEDMERHGLISAPDERGHRTIIGENSNDE